MEKRISKSFRAIFGRLYPNFDENETQNSEEYFNFILKNYPDKSEVTQLKAFFVIFSFGLRKLFIKDKNIPKYINNLQSSNISLFRKLGSGMTALFGLSTARSLNGEGSVYKHFDYPIYNNAKIEKKLTDMPESIEVAVIGSGSGGGVAAHLLNTKYEVGIFEKGNYANGETNNETFGYHNFYETYAMQQTRGYKVLLMAGSGVGGGTSINWTTSLRTPNNILNEWDSLTGQNNYFNSSNFKSSMDFICQQLNVSEANNRIPQKETKLAEGLSQNHISYKIIPRNTSNDQCLESGFSTFGHSDESINSSYKTWFPEDKFNSQNVYSNTSVKHLTISNGRATHINVEKNGNVQQIGCLLYTSPSPRDRTRSRMPSSA